MSSPVSGLFASSAPEKRPVGLTNDLRRFLDLPQRDAVAIGRDIAEPLTQELRQPAGTMTLRGSQAMALAETYDLKKREESGCLAMLPVGEGKTLLSFLLPVILEAKRPMLLVPGSLHGKTVAEFQLLAPHWKSHPNYRIETYNKLSRTSRLLELARPDLLVCDEVSDLAHTDSARTERVNKYVNACRKAGLPFVFCGLTGTLFSRSFMEWWHIQKWALSPALQPLPHSWPVLQSWCDALDSDVPNRAPVGQLAQMTGNDTATVEQVRSAFGARLRKCPGIIMGSGEEIGTSLRITYINRKFPKIDAAVKELRKTWCTPYGEDFSEATDLWRHARTIGNGFHYRWDPAPPEEWLFARREFHQFVRSVLSGSRTIETQAQVVEHHPSESAITWWQKIKNTYEHEQVAVWICDDVLEYALRWAEKTGGLVWVEHKAVGQRLAEFGLPYFGQKGLNAAGQSILHHRGPAAVSSIAVSKGFNLQYGWHENLVLNHVKQWQQLLGRTHRMYQPEPTVTCGLLFTVQEQRDGFAKAIRDAEYTQRMSKEVQKLCIADYVRN